MKLLRLITILALLAACAPAASAQTPTGSILHLEIENPTLYVSDCPDSQLAKGAGKLDRSLGPAFESAFAIADIVSVNGQPVKGATYETVLAGLKGSPNPVPGGALVDSPRVAVFQWDLDFLNPDGTQIGTVHINGLSGGMPPPGAPKEVLAGALAVTGGTGAFFGVRGYLQPNDPAQDPTPPQRITSACEDPALRRINGGGARRHQALYLVPLYGPQIMAAPNGPAVTHSNDFSLVTASKPATAGEILSLFATGLGPTRPGVDPGQPFPASPPVVVNSPVNVTVNGQPAEVLAAVGFPGAVDGYQVNFRMPPDTGTGAATIQVGSAWIVGAPVSIAVR